jgi:hypothetical protein
VALVAVNYDGVATFRTAFTEGLRTVSATYTGDEYHTQSTASLELTVARQNATFRVWGNPNPQGLGQRVTVSSYLYPELAPGSAYPTGLITIHAGNSQYVVPAPGGFVLLTTLGVGTHHITADYGGDDNFAPRTASYTQQILALPTITSISPNTGPVSGGQVVTITGTNLERATWVGFNWAPAASFVVNGPTSITATTPLSTTPGPVDVMVETAGGTAFLDHGYTYMAPAGEPIPTLSGWMLLVLAALLAACALARLSH